MNNKKLLLCILDGFGIRSESYGNAAIEAKFIYSLFDKYSSSYAQLEASEQYVGLPCGQFGNSEVGHMTIGAGRVVKQKIDIINSAISGGYIEQYDVLKEFCSCHDVIHIMGIFSSGGVHGHIDHIFWAADYLRRIGKKFWIHLFLDGRDVAYDSACADLENAITSGSINPAEIATIQGRFYAMDRDNNMDRTTVAYNAIVNASGCSVDDFVSSVRHSYESHIYDEQITPIISASYHGACQSDAFWMLNYRTDRIKQIIATLQEYNYTVMNMVNVDGDIDAKAQILFPDEPLSNTLGEIISRNGLKQLRVAETEKYAHVTYFFNGGRENEFQGEDRILVASPKIPDYSTCPSMSCEQVKDVIVTAMAKGDYNLIVANFANPDMVGHTGSYYATCKAIRCIDKCVEEIYNNRGEYNIIITSDHGNCEQMYTESGSMHKSHTCNPVPFVFIGDDDYCIRWSCLNTIADISPAILKMFGLQI